MVFQERIVALKPQDLVVAISILTMSAESLSMKRISNILEMPRASLDQCLDRCSICHLFSKRQMRVQSKALEQLIIYGVRYVFPVARGPITRGIPTSIAAPPLNHEMDSDSVFYLPVWPSSMGAIRGYTVVPLYSEVLNIVQNYPEIYELLALVDAIRDGDARERKLAGKYIASIFQKYRDREND